MKSYIKSLYYIITLTITFIFLSVCLVKADETTISVNIFSNTYFGSFSGELENNLPSGAGVFTYTDDNSNFTLTGTWNNGILNGQASIKYEDGSELKARYKNGFLSGKIQEYYSDGSYRTFFCSKGRPYGYIYYYNADNSPSGFDYFFQMQSINTLKKQSIDVDYYSLLNLTYDVNSYKINGTVLDIYEDEDFSYIILEDINKHLYVLTYKNTRTNQFNQGLVPNLIIGDNITAYGFLLKQDSLANVKDIALSTLNININKFIQNIESLETSSFISNNDNYNSTLPFIRLFAVELCDNTVSFNRNKPSYEYNDIVRNPYYYTNLDCTLKGEVLQVNINYEEQELLVHLKEDATENEYYFSYDFSTNDILPSLGSIISVTGMYYGNYKVPDQQESSTDNKPNYYIIYPLVEAHNISIIN